MKKKIKTINDLKNEKLLKKPTFISVKGGSLSIGGKVNEVCFNYYDCKYDANLEYCSNATGRC